jgi:hypothetical protein
MAAWHGCSPPSALILTLYAEGPMTLPFVT